MNPKNLEANKFYGKSTPLATASSSDSKYKIGDSVYIDFGPSGLIGPGRISHFMHFENEYGESFTGYAVTLEVKDGQEVVQGFYDSTWLTSADDKERDPEGR